MIVALDDRNGMMFNNRRQSQDVKLREYLIQLTQGSNLFLNQYSFTQFKGMDLTNVTVDDSFIEKANENDFCFVENKALAPYLNKINTIFVCRWNRDYPSDLKFDIDLSNNYKLISSVDIVGKSHKEITLEEWSKL